LKVHFAFKDVANVKVQPVTRFRALNSNKSASASASALVLVLVLLLLVVVVVVFP
jgi:hypothetical protein